MAVRKSNRSGGKKSPPKGGNRIRTHPSTKGAKEPTRGVLDEHEVPAEAKGRVTYLRRAFGYSLCEIRKETGISQDTLAELAGVDRTYPSLLERGKRGPTLHCIFLFAEALGVHPEELVARTRAHLLRLQCAASAWAS